MTNVCYLNYNYERGILQVGKRIREHWCVDHYFCFIVRGDRVGSFKWP